MPENVTPAMLMPSHEDDDSWLSWFLWWMPLTILRMIVQATNVNAMKIAWPASNQWRVLRLGEFMRWLGLWTLMTVYPCAGSRRNYWRGMLHFGNYMPEKRFEQILRAFSLPMYIEDDEEWGGPGREHYEDKKFDSFWETQRFCDMMKERFQNAMKPGGWLCVDECMFSWLAWVWTCLVGR